MGAPADPAAVLPGIDAHPHARAVLVPALPPGGRPSHAYLFHGPPGTGKRTVARAFAAALLADGAPSPNTVAERVARDAHPDLTWVVPSGAAEMLVGDVDEDVVAAATRTPFEAARRVFVIERAETMNDQAANRMLKTLEEPASFVHLILLADRPEDLLPTIASRCQQVRFDPLPVETLRARLAAQGVPEERAQACARLALGDSRLAQWLAGDDGQAMRQAAEAFVRPLLDDQPQPGSAAPLLEAARASAGRAGAEVATRLAGELELVPSRDRRRLERDATEAQRRAERRARTRMVDVGLLLIGLWLRDAACMAEELVDVVHAVDRRGALARDAAGRSSASLRAGVELVEDTRRRLAVHVSEDLALEALALRLAETLAR